ncbi:discoidin domain-containing protein [Streptomyces sp. NPDC051940]|uniref:GH39 family glycosyl hydrolase n=1 Tax=Streptomyces sp. NPDC051940 TaxID=3155675 RepID=UPI00341AD26B
MRLPNRTAKALAALLGTVAALAPVPAAADQSAVATVTVSAAYGTDAGALDKDLLLGASQGGYLSLRNLHVLADHAGELAGLGLREIRVDHVFDDEFYGVVKTPTSYDFTKLDSVLLPLADAGIKPWISLSYTPAALGPGLFAPPTDNAAWARAVTATVEHYEALGHTGWNWEVWNEPDHQAGFWTGTAAQYNALYQASAQAVRQADPTARVGGPGVATPTTGLLYTWLDYLAANPSVPCDFVSWHSYGPGDFASTAQIRSELSRRGIPEKKLYVTEWNSTFEMANGPGTWPDTHQTASYAAHRLFGALDEPGLDGVFFFSGLEGWAPRKDFNGDLGMMTADGRTKAVGNLFAMLGSLGGTRLTTTVAGATGTAAHALVTADPATRRVTALLWNDTLDAVPFQLALSALPYAGGNVAVTRTDIDAVAGNSWTDRAAGLQAQRPMPHERLRPSSRTVLGPTQSWSTSLTLAPNATTLIELTPTAETTGTKPLPDVTTTVDAARDAAVSYSSQYTDTSQGWFPAALTDGRRHSLAAANADGPTMGWTSAGHTSAAATEHVQVDLGSRQPFDAVTLWPRDDQAGDGYAFPADFTVAGSNDGSTWTTLVTRTGYGDGSPVRGARTFAVPGASYRHVRVTATRLGLPLAEAGGPAYRFQLAELEVTRQAVNVPVANPGFESGQLGGWNGNASVTASGARSGTRAATFAGAGNGVNTTVTGLRPDTTYTFSGYLRSATAGDFVHLGVKDYGGTELSIPVGAASYSPVSVTFTTGATSTTANLYAYKNSGTAQAWFDDFMLVQAG